LAKRFKNRWLKFLSTPAPWDYDPVREAEREQAAIDLAAVKEAARRRRGRHGQPGGWSRDKQKRSRHWNKGLPPGGARAKRLSRRLNERQATSRKAKMRAAWLRRQAVDKAARSSRAVLRRDPETGRTARLRYPWPAGPNAALALAFRPGEWIDAPELGRRSGLGKTTWPMLYQRFEPLGLVEKGRNADWRSGTIGRGVPRYLWRLTAAGLEYRAAVETIG